MGHGRHLNAGGGWEEPLAGLTGRQGVCVVGVGRQSSKGRVEGLEVRGWVLEVGRLSMALRMTLVTKDSCAGVTQSPAI